MRQICENRIKSVPKIILRAVRPTETVILELFSLKVFFDKVIQICLIFFTELINDVRIIFYLVGAGFTNIPTHRCN